MKNITDDYASFPNSTHKVHVSENNTIQIINDENNFVNIVLKFLLLSIPRVVILLSFIGLKKLTTPSVLFS